MEIRKEILDELIKDYKNPEDLIGENGLLKQLTKALLERAMAAELTHELGFEKNDKSSLKESGNRRNGTSAKTVRSKHGEIELEIPRWRATAIGKTPCPVSRRGLAPRRITKLLLDPTSTATETERNYLAKLLENAPAARKIQCLGIEFQQIIKERRANLFDEWLKHVRQSEIKEFESWAQGLLADELAVRNALSSPWSNGQTEGQVNRLKTIKRQMYGRAKFDLLRARVLHQD